MSDNYRFFSHTECEYFPCHTLKDGERPEEFNCLFCYCPLYSLGEECGGDFGYTEGIKDCSGCTIPHRPGGYNHIAAHLEKVIRMAGKFD